ncbi:MAG: hypothetical protein ACO4AJ_12580, partial [Prochlorothrix sp.]
MKRFLLSCILLAQVGMITHISSSLGRDQGSSTPLPDGDDLAQALDIPLESDSSAVGAGNWALQQTPQALASDSIQPKLEFISMRSATPAAYREVIERTKAMVQDATALSLADRFGLSILNVTWEDTGRYQDSAVGPNISDMSIQVQTYDPAAETYQLHLMPVIRFPNFADRSADIDLDALSVLVGNEKGENLKKVDLRDVLDNLRDYLHAPSSWSGDRSSLLADRDTHVLVSAQACFLPIPQGGTAEFNPVLFNYQSYGGNPAVLTILATREGTSVTVIDNTRDVFEAGLTWGQRLFFNKNGERASLTAQRASDFLSESPDDSGDAPPPTGDLSAAAEAEGLNLVMVIQVPLKQRARTVRGGETAMPVAAPPLSVGRLDFLAESDVEAAVIGHGEVEGPFTEIDDLAIERDERFPIRVTVQFYKATSNGVVSEADMWDIER